MNKKLTTPLLLLTVTIMISVINASCPYANMMQTYNFSGNWEMTEENGKSYVLHVCQPLGAEVYFGMAYNDTPNILIGFGGGNWSQWNLGIGGIRYMLDENGIDESGFLIGMNMENHQWWYRDNNRSLLINQTTQQWVSNQLCAIPFGYNVRREKYDKIKKARVEYHKKKRERSKAAKKNKVEVNEEEETVFEKELNHTVSNLVENYKSKLPTLINTTWHFNHDFQISFNENDACFSNSSSVFSMNNIKRWYDDVSILSQWSSVNDIHGVLFSMLLSNNEMLTSTLHSNHFSTFIQTKDALTSLHCDPIQNKHEL